MSNSLTKNAFLFSDSEKMLKPMNKEFLDELELPKVDLTELQQNLKFVFTNHLIQSQKNKECADL